jgi:hypothetical protein
MIQRRRLLLSLIAGWPVMAAAQVGTRVIDGQSFLTNVRVADTDLVLNGVGVRAVAWFKGYAAGLYLQKAAHTVEAVLATPGAKRLQMQMMQEVPAAEFVKALRKGIERNTDAAQMPSIVPRMQRFAALIDALGTVRKGDVVDLDLEPGRGLVFLHNGRTQGEPIEGEDLYAALLRAFIGERPYDKRLKAGLLGPASATPGS